MEQVSRFIWMRPGANLFQESEELIQVAFPDYTLTFKSAQIVRIIISFFTRVKSTHQETELINLISKDTKEEKEYIRWVLSQLESTDCLIIQANDSEIHDPNPLQLFFSYLYGSSKVLDNNIKSKVILITPFKDLDKCNTIFIENGITPITATVNQDTTNEELIKNLCSLININRAIIACWNFPLKLNTANVINDFSVQHKCKVLFGSCEGVMGRIGPFVIPKNTACLECMHLRVASNLTENDVKSYLAYRVKKTNVLNDKSFSHPGFENSILYFFISEVSRILLDLPSNCINSFYEYSFGKLSVERHGILKVPNCPVCGNQKPNFFPWDQKFSAITVKDNSI